ncbi:MAG: hypothetical protein M3301_10015 [Chloroflexota bacterium]|nr:hypothetical protein [Chloroflexota bacterium]
MTVNDMHDNAREDDAVTAGGGAHDITGTEDAEHVAQPSRVAHDEDSGAHGEAEEAPLGPVDWAAWRAAALGVAIAALICFLLYLAIAG